MITVFQSPTLNSVLPDGNDNVVIVQTNSGTGYYMRMEVAINDVLFSTRSISIDANGYARFNFKKFYDDYFVNSFSVPNTSGFFQKPGLIAKVTVTFKEYDLEDDSLNATLDLDDFYIIKATKGVSGPLATKGFYFNEIKVTVDALVCIPVYIQQGFPSVQVTDDDNNELWSDDSAVFPTNSPGQCVIKLSDISIPANTRRLKVNLKHNSTTFKVVYIYLLRDTHYPVKRIYYKSDEGIYATAYLSGKMEDERSLSPESYIDNDNKEVTYEVNEEANFTIEAGYRYAAGSDIIRAIALSTDVRLLHQSSYKRVTSQTKKILVKADNQFVYEDTLKFNLTM